MTGIRPESKKCIIVGVFAPVRSRFEYLPPKNCDNKICQIGQRVWVPFGRSFRLGVILATNRDASKEVTLKHIVEILDPVNLVSSEVIELAEWASSYYHYPIGETLAHIFPASLRRRKRVVQKKSIEWKATDRGRLFLASGDLKGVRQSDLFTRLSSVDSMTEDELKNSDLTYSWRPVLKNLLKKNLIVERLVSNQKAKVFEKPINKIALNSAQANARDFILRQPRYKTILLYGVTGGGKTEVYMEVVERLATRNKQSLVLVPEITLTEQIVARFRKRFGGAVGVLHSQCKESEKIEVWNGCRSSSVKILIGTRSAVWTPMKDLGLIVVDEEHDASYKQQDGLPYSGRDLAIKRGQLEGIPVVLGSATPSLETLANVSAGRYQETKIEFRAKAATEPNRELVDVSQDKNKGGISQKLRHEVEAHVSRGGQVLLFLNRRGYAPLVMCSSCGTHQTCKICERRLVYHRLEKSLVCHHCGRRTDISRVYLCCDQQNLFDIGFGTEQLEEKVRQLFPLLKISRIDRDKVKSAEAVRKVFRQISERQIDILIGTQMIAKGLDFSGITLVGIIDTDNRLYSIDYRSEERLAQLLTQVAGRCGRDGMTGEVLVQSRQPNNPILKRIVHGGYESYSIAALEERREMGMPPFSALAVVRADSSDEKRPERFLTALRKILIEGGAINDMSVSYPIPSLIRRKKVHYRSLVVMQCQSRAQMQTILSNYLLKIEDLGRRMKVRWYLEVDPEDTM